MERLLKGLVVISLFIGFHLSGLLWTPHCEPYSIVINEIMFAPRTGGPEWIEVFNRSNSIVDLVGWTMEDADSTKPRCITSISTFLEPNNYICIVQDKSTFISFFPSASCLILEPRNGWPRLNNTGDTIILRDSTGAMIDALTYDDHWGGSTGTSLERIHPDWPSNNPGTWSSSVSPSMASPCNRNSIFASLSTGKATLLVDPDPFDYETTISYRLTIPTAIMKLQIYDIQGRLVRTIIDQEPCGSTGSVTWNGTGDTGKELRTGVYILYLEAINAEMGVLDRVKKTVVLAKRLN